MPDDVATLAELFTHDGFATAAFVTSAISSKPALDIEGALGRGFATFHTSADDTTTLAAASDWARQDQGDGSRRFLWIHLSGPDRLWNASEPGAVWHELESALALRSFGPEATGPDIARFARGEVLPDATQERAAVRASCAYIGLGGIKNH